MFNQIKNRRLYTASSIAAVFIIFFCLISCGGFEYTEYYENGALATASPIATDVGVEIFKEGGNAFDVAVAVGFVMAVTHPEAGNIGGGGFAVIRNGSNGKVETIDFREIAPMTATDTMYLDENGDVIENLSTVGALAAGVPGTVAGLYELWKKYGTLDWETLVTPAVRLADTGFIVDNYLASSFVDYEEELSYFSSTKKIFLPKNKILLEGERLIQNDLAKTLYEIAIRGRDGFYKDEIAKLIADFCLENGGLITEEDLNNYQPLWREPIHFKFDSLDIFSMAPPSSGGYMVGQILKLIEPFEFTNYSINSSEYIHLFSEASRLAFADRSEHLGDPGFYDVPNWLLDDSYLKQRIDKIDSERVTPIEQITPGYPGKTESDQTTHFSIADKDGNMVAITYTLNNSFGSNLVVEGAGFLLNNEMDDFSIKPGHPNLYGLIGAEANKIEPGKRMLSSMSPTIILKDNKPFMIVGSPGGSKIITTVAQAIINFTRFNLSLNQTASQPRFHHQWLPDKLYLEEGGFDINIKQDLIRRGHDVQERTAYSDLQLIFIDDLLITAASDPRNNGKSSGF